MLPRTNPLHTGEVGGGIVLAGSSTSVAAALFLSVLLVIRHYRLSSHKLCSALKKKIVFGSGWYTGKNVGFGVQVARVQFSAIYQLCDIGQVANSVSFPHEKIILLHQAVLRT